MKHSFNLGFLLFFSCVSLAWGQPNTAVQLIKNLDSRDIINRLEKGAENSISTVNNLLSGYKDELVKEYQRQFQEVLSELNSLRDPRYQYQIYQVAKKHEGRNFYHSYGNGFRNSEDNTCVNAWCVVLAETQVSKLSNLTRGNIRFYPLTRAEETKKKNPNLKQKKPVYINVKEVLENAEAYGFLPLDLDLARRGDFCVQYYRKERVGYIFGPQHISIIDQIIPWKNGAFELRDWHEGIEDLPYTYRTGSNLKSSFNNVFRPENVYYGYQNDLGRERDLTGANPNVCQAYAYFGPQLEKARPLIEQLNHLRKQINYLENTTASIKP